MYDINEIKQQNKFDVWAILYYRLAETLVRDCGRRGELAVREGVRRLGSAEGKKIYQYFTEHGIKANMKNLYNATARCIVDPRARINILDHSTEVELFEVYTCPACDLWRKLGSVKLGSYYCEEYQWSLIKGYTDGKGQNNISMQLTCDRDNNCRFSQYYRLAHVAPEKRVYYTDGDDIDYLETPDERINRMVIDTMCYILEAAYELIGIEGVNAVANGLRSAYKDIEEFLVFKGDAVSGKFGKGKDAVTSEFLQFNFPVSIGAVEEEWNVNERARDLFKKHILDPLRKTFLE